MSTVIHNAYRVRPGVDIFDLTADIRMRAERRAKLRLAGLCRAVLENPQAHGIDALPRGATVPRVAQELRKRYRAQSASSLRDEFDFDVSVTATRAGRRWLLRAFTGDGMHGVLDFMRHMPELSDYSYDNRTDRPPRVTALAWTLRAATWNKVCDEYGQVRHQFVVEIVHPSLWLRIAPQPRRRR